MATIKHSIRLQMLLASVLILGLVISFEALNHHYKGVETELRALQYSISHSEALLLDMRRQEKDFLSRVDSKYIKNTQEQVDELKQNIKTIDSFFNKHQFGLQFSAKDIIQSIDSYWVIFEQLAKQKLLIEGENKTGLIEELKNAWFDLEKVMLLKGDERYDQTIIDLQESTYYFFRTFDSEQLVNAQNLIFKLSFLSNGDEENVQKAILNYQQKFSQLQQAYQQLGYNHTSGLHGSLRREIHDVESILETMHQHIPAQIQQKLDDIEEKTHIIMMVLLVSLIIVLSYATWSITRLERKLVSSEAQAKLSNKAKSTFLANMSHEIRTPLNGIIGMSQIIADTTLTPNQPDYLHAIDTSSQTLLMLINDVLDLSKIESGHIEITPYPADVRDAIYDTAAMIAVKASEKNIKLIVEICRETPYNVKIDEHRLRQILMNLVSNAVKFTDQGSVTISLDTRINAGECLLTFSVSDTGLGIDKHKLNDIFSPFKQEDSSITRNFGGTGLGLSISSQLATLLGGKLQVESEKGKGSRFFFTLPVEVLERIPRKQASVAEHACIVCDNEVLADDLEQSLLFYGITRVTRVGNVSHSVDSDVFFLFHGDNQKTLDSIEQLQKLSPSTPIIILQTFDSVGFEYEDKVDGIIKHPILGSRLISAITQSNEALRERMLHYSAKIQYPSTETKHNGKVLIVEDNSVNQQVVSLFLKKASYQYDIANNGLEALNKIKQGHRYQVLLMDCMMPEMDGFTATQEIRIHEKQNNLPSTPIVALTASVLDQDIKRCIDVGMDDYLAKPLRKDKLYSVLEKYI
ncbi:response regulator [Vibrio sp. 404]|uniref:Sensory/regulatory protein RpfC n=1 Tax=Vibrio marinisediminis TaxID=2758441 RepID=A0A7W2FMG1_9VIBR|nr:ATP-binding protein [Vibrio marinisediminis]MBA5760805.1 response regulator [Vibrio marinisediminis]